MELTTERVNLLESFELGKINKEELESKFGIFLNYEELRELLKSICGLKNEYDYNSKFHSILWSIPKRITQMEEQKLFTELLLMDGHNEHEEIARVFQLEFNNNKENIPVLLNAINNIPEYLHPEDFKYPYIRKIIYAIGAQPEPYNVQALEELAKSSDEQIRELALHQIEKRKKTRTWESKKKSE